MKVLIIGHMGMLGRRIASALKKQGREVHGCDSVTGLDAQDMFRINQIHYDLVVHCASLHGGGEPPGAADVALDAELLGWIQRTKPDRLVFFSGAEVYPMDLQKEPYRLKEGDFIGNASLSEPGFGWAKATAENLANQLTETKVHVFRPFSIYGSSRSVLEGVAQKINNREDPFILSDASLFLDFIHVDDVVNTVLSVVREDVTFSTINLCTGVPTPVDEIAEMMFEKAGWRPKTFLYGDTNQLFRCGDPTRQNTFWIPRVTLKQGIRETNLI